MKHLFNVTEILQNMLISSRYHGAVVYIKAHTSTYFKLKDCNEVSFSNCNIVATQLLFWS